MLSFLFPDGPIRGLICYIGRQQHGNGAELALGEARPGRSGACRQKTR